MIDEKMKKVLKIGGFVILGIFILMVFNLFFGKKELTNKSKGIQSGSVEISSPMGMYSARESMDSVSDNIIQDVETDNIQFSEDKKIIKTGNLNIKVGDTDLAVDSIRTIVKNNGGDIFSVNLNERVQGQKNGNVTVKVPNENFEKSFSQLKSVASHVVSESVSGSDVTEQYSDLEIQIRNKKAEEERFLAILNSAVKIDDILSITKEVSRVRREVETFEGRMKVLNSRVEMSSININLSEDTSLPVGGGWRPWEVVKSSFGELVRNIQGFIDNIINFLIVGLPILLIYGIVILIFYRIGKKIYIKFLKK